MHKINRKINKLAYYWIYSGLLILMIMMLDHHIHDVVLHIEMITMQNEARPGKINNEFHMNVEVLWLFFGSQRATI